MLITSLLSQRNCKELLTSGIGDGIIETNQTKIIFATAMFKNQEPVHHLICLNLKESLKRTELQHGCGVEAAVEEHKLNVSLIFLLSDVLMSPFTVVWHL